MKDIFLNYKEAEERAFFLSIYDLWEEWEPKCRKIKASKRPIPDSVQRSIESISFSKPCWMTLSKRVKLPPFVKACVSIRSERWNSYIFSSKEINTSSVKNQTIFLHESIHLLRQRLLGDEAFEESLAWFLSDPERQAQRYVTVLCNFYIKSFLLFVTMIHLFAAFFLENLFLEVLSGGLTFLSIAFLCIKVKRQEKVLTNFCLNLSSFLQEERMAKALMLRLTQEEIELIANSRVEQLKVLLMNWVKTQERWKVYGDKFFKKTFFVERCCQY